MKYDLEERLLNFSKNILDFCVSNSKNFVLQPVLNQLLRSATSIGANYNEANETDSHKEFLNIIRISKKEARECNYWLKILDSSSKVNKAENLRILLKESEEICKIISSIYYNSKAKLKK